MFAVHSFYDLPVFSKLFHLEIADKTVAADVVAADFLGAEERVAKLKMRASLKGIKRPGSIASRLGSMGGIYLLHSLSLSVSLSIDIFVSSSLSIYFLKIHP